MAAFLAYFVSPLGLMEISGSEQALTAVQFVENKTKAESPQLPKCIRDCRTQLEDYFRGSLRDFDLPLQFEGTEFQLQVWQELARIPYGKITSYYALARKIGNPNAVRAIGNTNAKNKLCLVLPCHRVIGNEGKLVGYAGGLWRKEWLLAHEQSHCGFRQLKLF